MANRFEERCGVFFCRGCGWRRVAGNAIRWRDGYRCKDCERTLLWIALEELPLIAGETDEALAGAYLCAFCEEFIAGDALTKQHWNAPEERLACPQCARPLFWIERCRTTS